jgi:hypothetical protein
MHEELWAGVDLKNEHAAFFLEQMGQALAPPPRTQINVALQATGAIVGTGWQRSIYAYLDAFLAMARSVPEIIHACFGADLVMKKWFLALPKAEQDRRNEFTTRFEIAYKAFKTLPLSNARNVSLHRSGIAPVEVKIVGRFGVSHIGTPIKRVADAESRPIGAGTDPALQWAATLPPVPVEPRWTDFTIDGRPLFPECRAYLEEAAKLVTQARAIAKSVHGTESLTPPPTA